MLLTEYDEKLHLKTVHNEGYEAGYDVGQADGYNQGQTDGYSQGQATTLYRMVQSGKIEIKDAADDLGIETSEFKANMLSAGYKLP